MSEIIQPSFGELALAACFILLPAAVSVRHDLGVHRDLLVGGLRCFAQLVLVGYVLKYVFGAGRPEVVLAVLAVMVVAGGQTAAARQKQHLPGLFRLTTTSILVTSALTLAYTTVVIVRIEPWYDPRYLIPLAGMVIGNAMNGSALAAERLDAELRLRHQEIEVLLSLGASPRQSSEQAIRATIRASLIPTVNGLMAVGIVHLPGMMTGQMLGGASPVTAVRYQIVIFYALTFVATATAMMMTSLAYRRYYTPRKQLIRRPSEA